MNNNSEEKHKKDLEAAKNWYKIAEQQNNEVAMNILKDLFPELRESEDERIRKSLIRNFTNQHSSNFPTTDGFTREQILAWLDKQAKQNYIDADEDWYKFVRWFVKERTDNYTLIPSDDDIHYWGNIILHHARKLLKKQGENHIGSNNEMVKPSDKVGPKFKVGDWIVQGNSLCQIEKVIDLPGNHFQYWTTDEHWFGDGTEAHLWTLQDAKDGDVISYDDGWTCIFKNIHGIWYSSYCFIADGEFNTGYERHAVDAKINGNVNPATKEQRDLLFSKMKEAGYEWDPEKKELKMIKPDFQKIQWKGNNLKEIVEFTGKSPKFNNWFKTWEEYENYVHAHNNIFKLFNEDGSHFEVPVGAWIVKTPDGYNVASKSTFIQNHKWSEEDEYQINTILHGLDLKRELYKNEGNKVEEKRYSTQYDWLKSLKDRIQPQPKQDWSEGDDYAIEKLLCLLDNEQDNYPQLSCDFQELEEIKNWLKSLKPQNRWKPSDLQLEALESAYKQLPNIQHFLQSLYNDLKNI